MGQADIHHSLSLGILFKTPDDNSGNILKEVLFKCNELNMHVQFKPISGRRTAKTG